MGPPSQFPLYKAIPQDSALFRLSRRRGWLAGLRATLAFALTASVALDLANPAFAGPPYVTDDPEPTDTGHWEIYQFAAGSGYRGTTSGQAGLDINYGGAQDLQLTVTLPADYTTAEGAHLGAGNVELAAKYRFIHASDSGLMPDIAFFPRALLPVAHNQFNTGRVGLLLPVWAEKDQGAWSIFGGGGYEINPGFGQRNFWTGGVAVTHACTDRLTVGLEVYGQGATNSAEGSGGGASVGAYAGLNLGVTYKLSEHWALLGAAGPALHNPAVGGRFNFYAAALLTF